jgi:hypothetical protein
MPEKFYEIDPRNKWPGLFVLFIYYEKKQFYTNDTSSEHFKTLFLPMMKRPNKLKH